MYWYVLYLPTINKSNLQVNKMAKITDEIIILCLSLLFILFEEVKALITPNNKIMITKKSKTELKKMLKGELVELVIAYQT